MAVYQLAKNTDWKQLWWDGTSRRTASMTTFAAGAKESESIRPILLSCSHITKGGTSEETVEAIKEIIDNGQDYLTLLFYA